MQELLPEALRVSHSSNANIQKKIEREKFLSNFFNESAEFFLHLIILRVRIE